MSQQSVIRLEVGERNRKEAFDNWYQCARALEKKKHDIEGMCLK